MLKSVSTVLYLDADTIITSKLEKIWAKFRELDDHHVLGAIGDCAYEKYSKIYRDEIGLELNLSRQS